MRSKIWLVAVATVLTGVACNNASEPTQTADLTNAFATTPVGFDATSNSFSATSGVASGPWQPRAHEGALGFGLMGGGLGPDFAGGIGFGRGRGGGPGGFGHGPFHPFSERGLTCTGTYSTAIGRLVCDTETHDGLTINRSISYKNAAGATQQAYDSAMTNTINVQVSVAGTVTRRDDATAKVSHASEQTVSGLAPGSTQRTVNGASKGQEDVTGTSDQGAYTATRVVGDTTRGLVIPITDGRPTYPTAGTVIREMNVTVTVTGQAATTHSRREVITYNGTDTATIVITQDGTTKTCTLALPRGRPSCS